MSTVARSDSASCRRVRLSWPMWAWMAPSAVRAASMVFSPCISASLIRSWASRRALSFISSTIRCVVTRVSCSIRSRCSSPRVRSSAACRCSFSRLFSFSKAS